ncbi:Uncharacterised protein [Mycobacteroides abscessus subsp. abscessus]|nr:Uncharacterised protein [Mycobacteroides abscessus subsp. abscessus]
MTWGQIADAREVLHHLGVGEDVSGADVEGAVDRLREVAGGDEVVEDVADGQRFDPVGHPVGRGHPAQGVGEVPDHLERRRPGADDDPSLEDDRRGARGEEDLPDLRSGAHVHRQLRRLGVEAAEVDDLPAPGRSGGLDESRRRLRFVSFEVAAGVHRVDEVADVVDALHRRLQAGAVVEVDGVDGDLIGPGHRAEFVRRAHAHAHGVPGLEEAGHEAAADVAGGPEHEHRAGMAG